MKTTNLLKSIEKYILVVTVALFAIFILPKFSSPFSVPKEIFGATTISLVLLFWVVRSVIKGEFSFSIGKFDFGVLLITLAYIISAIVKSPNKMEAFFFPGTVTFVIIAALFYFLINQFDKKAKNLILITLFGSGILLSISVLFTELGLFGKIPQLPAFMKSSTFSPAGGNLPSVIYLAAILPIGINLIIKEKELVKRVFCGVSSVVIVFAGTVLITSLLPGKTQAFVFPNLQTSWEVVIETIKQSPIFGVGPDNYISAFNLFRSISYNQSTIWLARFSTAGNYYFTLVTEVGFIGLAAMSVLLISIHKGLLAAIRESRWEALSVAVLIILFVILPSAPVLIFLLMVLLAVFSKSEDKSINLATGKVPATIIAVPVIFGVATLAFFGTRAVVAEMTYQKSLNAMVNNNAKDTYDLMIKAAQSNPYVDRYHASLAQIDMALATSFANKKDLTNTDRQNITQLVGQAINEGKATVSLNPGRSGNWEILAQIYGSIMAFAQGADQYAIQTYSQAVALDPINPNLRISLGGIYYALGRYDEAIDAFKLAVLAKPNLANAHYNLGIAYREKKNFDSAITEMNTVLTLVAKDSPDYTLAKNTLDALEKAKPVASAANGAQSLTTPQKQVSVIQPPIEIPKEATPPTSP